MTGATIVAGCSDVLGGGTVDREDLHLGEAVEYWRVTFAVTDAVATERLRARDAEVRAREWEWFVLIFVEATNDTDEPASVPVPGLFEIQSDRGTYDAETNVWRALEVPVEGALYRGADSLEPGATRAGWIDFVVYREARDLKARVGRSERDGDAEEAAAWNLPDHEDLLVDPGAER